MIGRECTPFCDGDTQLYICGGICAHIPTEEWVQTTDIRCKWSPSWDWYLFRTTRTRTKALTVGC